MLTKHEIRRTAQRILRYVNLPLSIHWGHSGPAINMETRAIMLPTYLKGREIASVEFSVGHEVGHPHVFPKTAVWMTYYAAYASTCGYQDPHDFQNVIGDLFVNDWNLTRAPWKRNFRKQSERFYDHEQASDPRFSFIVRMMRARFVDLDGGAPRFTDDTDEEAFRLLFHDSGTLKVRYEQLAQLLANKLKAMDLYRRGQNAGGGSVLANGDASDDAAMQATSGLGTGGGIAAALSKTLARRELFELGAITIFSSLMVTEHAGGASEGEEETGSRLRARWYPGNRLGDLDVRTSLRRHGVLIPGVTTMKRPVGIRRPKPAAGTGTLFLVIDTSGSMDGVLDLVTLIAWGAVMGARNRRDRVAIMEFDGDARYRLAPGERYDAAREILETLGCGGGTRLLPALKKVVRVSEASGRKPTVLVLSDFGLSDDAGELSSQVARIHALGGRVLLGATPDADRRRFRELFREAGVFAFQINEPTSVREAVSRLR